MIKDIEFPEVEAVSVAVVQSKTETGDNEWKVYVINKGKNTLENLMISSKGYGKNEKKEEQKTSILRHFIGDLESGEFGLVEPIDSQVFHLFNEYWVSFYIGKKVYDKKFIFVPDSIKDENLTKIPIINEQGILHN